MYEQISSNQRKTVLLIVGAMVFLGAFGFVLGAVFYSVTEGIVWMIIGISIAAVQSFISLRYGDRMVLAASHARKVTPEEDPRLHNIVDGLAIAAGIPKPEVYLVAEQAPNAFATGRDPEHASIAVTQGLLDMMNRVELEGVIAHELSHVGNRDMLVSTVVATLVGAVVMLSQFFLRWTFWGGGGRRSSSNSGGDGGNPVQLVLLLVGIVLILLAPMFAGLIQMAVSRQREYLADASGAMLTRYPPGLAAALKKIQANSGIPMRFANDATAHLWLNQPSKVEGDRSGRLERLFNTHPPIADRIKRLEEM